MNFEIRKQTHPLFTYIQSHLSFNFQGQNTILIDGPAGLHIADVKHSQNDFIDPNAQSRKKISYRKRRKQKCQQGPDREDIVLKKLHFKINFWNLIAVHKIRVEAWILEKIGAPTLSHKTKKSYLFHWSSSQVQNVVFCINSSQRIDVTFEMKDLQKRNVWGCVFRFILPVQESNCMSHSLNLNVTLRVR
jgi:hypothetical protein